MSPVVTSQHTDAQRFDISGDSSDDDDEDEEAPKDDASLSHSAAAQMDFFSRRAAPSDGGTPETKTVAIGAVKRNKELDEIKGIGPWPSTAAFNGWRRNTRYTIAAASSSLQAALEWILVADHGRAP